MPHHVSLEGFSQGPRTRVCYIKSNLIKADTDPTNTEITVRLDEAINAGPLEVLNCAVTDVIIPFSFYMLSAALKNNVVAYTYTGYKDSTHTVSSLVKNSGSTTVALATTSTAHGLTTGDSATISGATPDVYNGTYTVTVTSSTQFTYTHTASDDDATGTIQVSSVSSSKSTASSTITFTPENYSVYTFMSDIKTALNSFLESEGFMVGDGTASPTIVTYTRTTNKLTFNLQTENSATQPLLPKGTFTFLFTQASGSALNSHILFGFPITDTQLIFGNDDTAGGTNAAKTSPFVINLNTVNQVILKGSFSNRNMIAIKGQETEVSSILSILPIVVPPFQFMSLAGATNRPIVRIPGREISVFTLKLETDGGLPIDLNGIGWQVVIEFYIKPRDKLNAPKSMYEKLAALGLREDNRVLPANRRLTVSGAMSKEQPNLAAIKARASLKRRRPPTEEEEEKEAPPTDQPQNES